MSAQVRVVTVGKQGPPGTTGQTLVEENLGSVASGATVTPNHGSYTNGALVVTGAPNAVTVALGSGITPLGAPRNYCLNVSFANAGLEVNFTFTGNVQQSTLKILALPAGNFVKLMYRYDNVTNTWTVERLYQPPQETPFAAKDYGNPGTFPTYEWSKYTFFKVKVHGTTLDASPDYSQPGKRAIFAISADAGGARTVTIRNVPGTPLTWIGGTPAWSSTANQVDQVEVWEDAAGNLYGKLLGLNTG